MSCNLPITSVSFLDLEIAFENYISQRHTGRLRLLLSQQDAKLLIYAFMTWSLGTGTNSIFLAPQDRWLPNSRLSGILKQAELC